MSIQLKQGTALHSLFGTVPLSSRMVVALRNEAHPQERTHLFHEVFDAPIHTGKPDATFSHMDDQRVAFRMAFILSEALEILEQGLGLSAKLIVSGGDETFVAPGSDNARLAIAIQNAMSQGGHRDLVGVVDGLGDLNVVVNGWAVELGVDMDLIDQEILASNLTKMDEDGKPIVADGSDARYPAGKILKGPNYVPAQIGKLLGFD